MGVKRMCMFGLVTSILPRSRLVGGVIQWEDMASKKSKRNTGTKQVRKLTKVGGGRSYSVALPREVIRRFGWKERQKLTVTVDVKNRKLVIRDWKGNK